MPSPTPTLRQERQLLRAGATWVAGMDEVGRGALAGPVSVGVTVVGINTRTAPAGVRDSKLLTPSARVSLAPKVRRWAVAGGVGHASEREIDAYGIIAALRLAGRRALARLDLPVDVVLLDGSHNWLAHPEPTLFEVEAGPNYPELMIEPQVVTLVKADRRCASVAGASVLAKVERDQLMIELAREYPGYAWAENKGYAAPEHLAGLSALGPCERHRLSWNITACRKGGEPQPATRAPVEQAVFSVS